MRIAALLLTLASLLSAEQLLILHKHDESLGLYDGTTGKMLKRLPVGTVPHEMALTRDGKQLFITNYGVRSYTEKVPGGGTIHIVNMRDLSVQGTISTAPHTRPHGIERGKSGRFYVTTDFPAALLVIDPAKQAVIASHPLDQQLPHMLALTPDERKAYVACAGSASLVVLDLKTGKQRKVLPIGGVPMGLTITRDGRTVYVGTREGNQVHAIDAATDSIRTSASVPGNPARVHLSGDEKRLVVSLIGSGEVAILNTADLKETARRAVGERAEGLATHPDGKHFFISAQAVNKVLKISFDGLETALTIDAQERPDPIIVLGTQH